VKFFGFTEVFNPVFDLTNGITSSLWFLSLLLFLVAALVSLGLTPLIGKLALYLGATDIPGERKIHSQPIPRLGGVCVVVSVVCAVNLWSLIGHGGEWEVPHESPAWFVLIIGGLWIFIVGLWDDIYSLGAGVKFLLQSVAALTAIGLGVQFNHFSFLGETGIEIGWLAYPLTFLWIIGITNAFNLVDGLDGLSTGLASIAAGTSAMVFFLRGNYPEALLLFIVLGALVGFLRYNFFPAKIFLGDSGSLFVGYTLAITAITGSQKGVTALAIIFPLLVFGLPIADTLLSMFRRFFNGLTQPPSHSNSRVKQGISYLSRVFVPDQDHIHHRLLSIGFSHRHAVLLLYGLAFLLAALAFITVLANGRNAGLVLILVGLATYVGISKLGYKEVRVVEADTLLRLYEKLGLHKIFFLGFLDLFLIAISYWASFFLKYEPTWNSHDISWYRSVFPISLAIQFGVFYVFGLYNGIWRALSTGDILRISFAVCSGILLSSIVSVISFPPSGNLGFVLINLLFLLGAMIGCRSTFRILDYFRFWQIPLGQDSIIYGAGQGGQLVLREMFQNSNLGFRPIGFLDDDPALIACTVNRLPVLGSIDNLEEVLTKHPHANLVVASQKIQGDSLKTVFEVCRKKRVKVYKGQIQIYPLPSSLNSDNQSSIEVEEINQSSSVLCIHESEIPELPGNISSASK